MTTDQNRAYYLDVLRIIATLAVVTLHVSAQNWDTVDIHSFAWHVFNFFDSLVRWAVPVFIMISGAVFLDNDRPLSIRKLYRKNVLRLVIVYFVWATVYAVDKWIMGATLKDVILSIDGRTVTDTEELNALMYSYSAGDTVVLEVYRSGQQLSITMTLGEATP